MCASTQCARNEHAQRLLPLVILLRTNTMLQPGSWYGTNTIAFAYVQHAHLESTKWGVAHARFAPWTTTKQTLGLGHVWHVPGVATHQGVLQLIETAWTIACQVAMGLFNTMSTTQNITLHYKNFSSSFSNIHFCNSPIPCKWHARSLHIHAIRLERSTCVERL